MGKSIITIAMAAVFAAFSSSFAQDGLFSDVRVNSVFDSSEEGDSSTPSTPKQETKVENVEQLKLMLIGAGLEGTKLGDRVVGIKKQVENTSFLVLISMTEDLKNVQITVLLGNAQDPSAVTSEKLVALMDASREVAPSHFSFSKKRRRFELFHTLQNKGISSEILGSQIDRLARIAVKKQDLWKVDSAPPTTNTAKAPPENQTTPDDPTPPAAPESSGTQLVGRWFATKSSKEALAIQLNKDGTFALVYVNDGKQKTSTGTFEISGDSLTFNGKDGTKLSGTVKLSSTKEFRFTPASAKSALVFNRAQ